MYVTEPAAWSVKLSWVAWREVVDVEVQWAVSLASQQQQQQQVSQFKELELEQVDNKRDAIARTLARSLACLPASSTRYLSSSSQFIKRILLHGSSTWLHKKQPTRWGNFRYLRSRSVLSRQQFLYISRTKGDEQETKAPPHTLHTGALLPRDTFAKCFYHLIVSKSERCQRVEVLWHTEKERKIDIP